MPPKLLSPDRIGRFADDARLGSCPAAHSARELSGSPRTLQRRTDAPVRSREPQRRWVTSPALNTSRPSGVRTTSRPAESTASARPSDDTSAGQLDPHPATDGGGAGDVRSREGRVVVAPLPLREDQLERSEHCRHDPEDDGAACPTSSASEVAVGTGSCSAASPTLIPIPPHTPARRRVHPLGQDAAQLPVTRRRRRSATSARRPPGNPPEPLDHRQPGQQRQPAPALAEPLVRRDEQRDRHRRTRWGGPLRPRRPRPALW